MQDPYSTMMQREGQYMKPYGRSNMGLHSNYYNMPYNPMVSHAMSMNGPSDLHVSGLLSSAGPSSSSSPPDYSTSSHSNGHGPSSGHSMMNTPQGLSNHHANNNVGQLDIHSKNDSPLGVGDMMSSIPVPTSSPIPSVNMKHESDSSHSTDHIELSSPSSSGSNPSTPLDLKSNDGDSKVPPKKRPNAIPESQKDDAYWEKRKKNNDSAKRSREARRMKEEQIALRVVFLEQENLQLRTEVTLLKSEIEKLRCMLYNP